MLVTKEELDLVRQQLNARWSGEVDYLTRRIAVTQSTIRDMQRKAAGDLEEDENIETAVIKEDNYEISKAQDTVGRSLTFQHKMRKILQAVEVKQQREAIAAMHGHSGLCCCAYFPRGTP